jgi:cAMP phosphodiesterase
MNIKVLGSFGSELPGCCLTGFLFNNHVMVDAGTISTALTVSEQAKITHIVLSHAHLDHTKGIPFMADNVIGKITKPVEIAAAESVLETFRDHIFNNKVWPDFTRIPSLKSPVMKYKRLTPGREAKIGAKLTFRPVWVNHTVPTTGFIIREGRKAVAYSGDTKATDSIWKAASKLGKELRAVFIETSFPNRLQSLADLSGHLTPQSLGDEIAKLKGYDGPVYVYHVKSQYIMDIEREIDALDRKDVIVVRDGMEWDI